MRFCGIEIGYQNSDLKWRYKFLKYFNLALFFIHAAIGLTALGAVAYQIDKKIERKLNVTIAKQEGRPGYGAITYGNVLYDINPQVFSIVFSGVTALFHLGYYLWFPKYKKLIQSLCNYFRWLEYCITASLMIVQISLLNGIVDVTAHLPIFGTVFAMIWFGYFTEVCNYPDNLYAFILGSIVGMFPWTNIFVAYGLSKGEKPVFVTVIVIGQFFQFMQFAVVSALVIYYKRQNQKNYVKSQQSDEGDLSEALSDSNEKLYATGEVMYCFFSLTTKAFLTIALFIANL